MRISVLDIMVIDLYFVGGFPLKEASEHFSCNQSVISGVILLSFWYYLSVVLVILLFIYHFSLFIYVFHTFYMWNITGGASIWWEYLKEIKGLKEIKLTWKEFEK
jgi:hypothetical protein